MSNNTLLKAIIVNPNDDTLRLAYADWLDENGRPEEAELIRLEIDLEQEPCRGFMVGCEELDEPYCKCRTGERKAKLERVEEIKRGIPDLNRGQTRKGLLWHIWLSLESTSEKDLARLFARHPIEQVLITDKCPYTHTATGFWYYHFNRDNYTINDSRYSLPSYLVDSPLFQPFNSEDEAKTALRLAVLTKGRELAVDFWQ